jgi:poly-beta-hydroxyalkanoate depolymerase
MYCIYIETERTQNVKGSFDLIHTIEHIENSRHLVEVVETYESNDRLRAAIVNTGIACRWYYDRNITRGYIELKSDTDGKDYRHEREHNILYTLLYPTDDYEAKKHLALYSEYNKYIGKVRHLIYCSNITVHLGEVK